MKSESRTTAVAMVRERCRQSMGVVHEQIGPGPLGPQTCAVCDKQRTGNIGRVRFEPMCECGLPGTLQACP